MAREERRSWDRPRRRRDRAIDRGRGVGALPGSSSGAEGGAGWDAADRYRGPFRRHDDPRAGGRRDDDSIRDELLEQLHRRPEVDASGIDVLVEEGEVTLQGTVAGRDLLRLAEGAAESVAGVSLVHNRLRLDRP